MARIKHLKVKGFRAYGAQAVSLEFAGPIAVIWAPNSQGKTSLAEAIEFLLTGKTVRRELIASAKREFAEALRHAHLPQSEEVIVEARIEDVQGNVHHVERRLVRDYTGRDPCQSKLTVDGTPAADLTSIGIRLSQPPLEAPVLMPHTLRYVLSAEPQQRTDYFKALLEVSDLEEIRDAIADAKNRLSEPTSNIASTYERCRSNPQFGNELAPLETTPPSRDTIEAALAKALEQIIQGHGPVPEGLYPRLSAAKELLGQQRARTFPVDALAASKQPSWGQKPDIREPLEAFLQAKRAVDKEVTRSLRLFEEVLKVPEIAEMKEAVDCPVCETPHALTPERINVIRQKVEANAQFTNYRQKADRILDELRAVAQNAIREAKDGCPLAMSWQEQDWSRYKQALEELIANHAEAVVPPWEKTLANLKQAREHVQEKANALQKMLDSLRLDDLDEAKIKQLDQGVTDLFQSTEQFSNALIRYQEVVKPLLDALKQEVDRRAGTQGWQDLIDLCENREALLRWLIERTAYRALQTEVEEAIRDIDRAKAEVLDDKFTELGQEIVRWWNLLRPDEPTSFHGLQRGGTGRRYIDLKARLSNPDAADSQGVLRDAVAVFSDSQLNALGLACFLARTIREEIGFVILDDPVPATDREHRAFFINKVLEELLGAQVQVILLTHDEKMRKDVEELYAHVGLDSFTIVMDDPAQGAIIKKIRDTLDGKLELAERYLSRWDPESQKNAARTLRDAAERFCKLMLVHHRRTNGEDSALVTDYDGRTLSWLRPKVEPLLTKDPSHSGKLRVICMRLPSGSHDDEIPPIGDLKQSLGDLKTLRREYLP